MLKSYEIHLWETNDVRTTTHLVKKNVELSYGYNFQREQAEIHIRDCNHEKRLSNVRDFNPIVMVDDYFYVAPCARR